MTHVIAPSQLTPIGTGGLAYQERNLGDSQLLKQLNRKLIENTQIIGFAIVSVIFVIFHEKGMKKWRE